MNTTYIKILVAEDNEFNQIVIKRILERIGSYSFDFVEDGLAAFNRYKSTDYDIILLDYHMPKLNGSEVAKKIREHEQNTHKKNNVPIISMTADSLENVKDKCALSGMNDYVTKPINEAVLKAKIQEWIQFSKASPKADSQLEEDKGPQFDLSLLAEYTNNDVSIQRDLIKTFFEKTTEDINTLKNNCHSGCNDNWVKASHSLKGSSGYLGATTLEELCSIAQSYNDTTANKRAAILKRIEMIHGKICNGLQKLDLLEQNSSA